MALIFKLLYLGSLTIYRVAVGLIERRIEGVPKLRRRNAEGETRNAKRIKCETAVRNGLFLT